MAESTRGRVRILEQVIVGKDRNPHADPPITVWQGPVFRRLAQVSAQPDTCRNFLLGFEAIRDQNLSLLQLLLAHGVATIPDYLHLKEHWFNDATGWWRGQRAEQVMTDGLQGAFEAANASGLPLQCYWIIYDLPSPPPAQHVFTRLMLPPRPQCGTYQDAGYYSILFQFCTPPVPGWKPQS